MYSPVSNSLVEPCWVSIKDLTGQRTRIQVPKTATPEAIASLGLHSTILAQVKRMYNHEVNPPVLKHRYHGRS